jgi:hypothetical protein
MTQLNAYTMSASMPMLGLQSYRDGLLEAQGLAQKSRTIDELWSVIADRLRALSPDECRHNFEAAGDNPE